MPKSFRLRFRSLSAYRITLEYRAGCGARYLNQLTLACTGWPALPSIGEANHVGRRLAQASGDTDSMKLFETLGIKNPAMAACVAYHEYISDRSVALLLRSISETLDIGSGTCFRI